MNIKIYPQVDGEIPEEFYYVTDMGKNQQLKG